MTTESQIETMKSMCSELAKLPAIKSAYVDDWGRFGNFQVMVTPQTHDRHTTTQLRALVRKHLPKGAMVRDVFGPDPVRERQANGHQKIVGYSRNFWVVDIDYLAYCPATNTFSS